MALFIALYWVLWVPISESATVPITFPNGHTVQAEVARTPKEHALGLMGRTSLPPNHGMLFIFKNEEVHGFWMKNTLLVLDMIWLDSQKRIIDIIENAPPCKKDPCPSFGPSSKSLFVLEINGGMARKQALKIGMTLKF